MTTNPAFHRSLGILLGLLVGVFSSAAAQAVYVYSEPSVCTQSFRPNEVVTHHAGESFEVTWYLNFPQYGPVRPTRSRDQ